MALSMCPINTMQAPREQANIGSKRVMDSFHRSPMRFNSMCCWIGFYQRTRLYASQRFLNGVSVIARVPIWAPQYVRLWASFFFYFTQPPHRHHHYLHFIKEVTDRRGRNITCLRLFHKPDFENPEPSNWKYCVLKHYDICVSRGNLTD